MAERQVLYLKVYESLLHDIKSGKLKDGDKLPSEAQIADMFDVSIITSKKALNMLVDDGVIIRRQGLGSFVNLGDKKEQHTGALTSSYKSFNKIIGLIIEDFSDSFGIELLCAIEKRATELGYHLCIKRSLGDQAVEGTAIDNLMELGVTGVIIMPSHGNHYNTKILKMVVEGIPVVLVDNYLNKIQVSYAGTDNMAAAKALTQHLVDLSHRHIAVISTSSQDSPVIEDRIAGFSKICEQNDLNYGYIFDQVKCTRVDHQISHFVDEDTDRVYDYLLNHPEITAIIAMEYNITSIIKRACKRLEKRIPQDVSLACFDSPRNYLEADVLTHMKQNEEMIGRTSVDMIISMDKNHSQNDVKMMHKTFDAKLILGYSTIENKA